MYSTLFVISITRGLVATFILYYFISDINIPHWIIGIQLSLPWLYYHSIGYV